MALTSDKEGSPPSCKTCWYRRPSDIWDDIGYGTCSAIPNRDEEEDKTLWPLAVIYVGGYGEYAGLLTHENFYCKLYKEKNHG